jgi:hypothetical protein
MKPLFFLSVLFIFTTLACSKKECDEALTTTKFKVGIAYCLNENQTITIDSIEDSRCPLGASCIWEGDTQLFMNMFQEDIDLPFIITVPNNNNEYAVKNKHGYDYTIKSISPYPNANVDEKQSDYTVEMIIVKSK